MKLQTIPAMNWIARLVGLLIFVVPMVAHAQPWSGIIGPSRATDWRGAGAAIATRTTNCASIAPYTGSAAAINNAISACPSGQVVQLGSGTFNLSTGIELDKSNVTLRGMGAGATILKISGLASGCHIGEGRVAQMCTNAGNNIGVDSPEHTATWAAGYAKGTTIVTLSNSTGLNVGQTLWLDQISDTSDGFPVAGDLFQCDDPTGGCSNQSGGDSYARSGRGVVEGQIVVSCSPSCNSAGSTQVTISPGVRWPAIRSSQNPGAWWGNAATVMNSTGLENLTIDMTPSGGAGGLYIVNCTNCWVKGVRFVKSNTTGANIWHVFTVNAMNLTLTDNYFYGPPTTQLIAIYQLAMHVTSSSLFQNNIHHSASASIVPNSTVYGNVIAYNYIDGGIVASIILHGLAGMNLYEGNNGANFSGDIIHASHSFETLFRNHFDGRQHNPSATETQAGVALYSKQRFFNIVGNVIGDAHWTTYQTNMTYNGDAIYEFGWQGTGSGSPVANDPNVARTVMRWGNYDKVTNTARFVASEVPSAIPNFSNPVPANQTLPPSFYLSQKPSAWWAPNPAWGLPEPPWPPIGPDVTGSSLPSSGGHAHKIPARLCFENTVLDPAYPSSNPRIRLFNASTCYAQTPQSVPAPPGAPVLQ